MSGFQPFRTLCNFLLANIEILINGPGKNKSLTLLLGCRRQSQTRNGGHLFGVIYFFSSVSVKVLPVTPLVSGIFVHRAFCAYFLRIERVVELRRFLWWTQ